MRTKSFLKPLFFLFSFAVIFFVFSLTSQSFAQNSSSSSRVYPDGFIISGRVYTDTNENSVKDTSEKGLDKASVEITDSDGLKKFVATDTNGSFLFAPKKTGVYTVTLVLPEGYKTPTLKKSVVLTSQNPRTRANFPIQQIGNVGTSGVQDACPPDPGDVQCQYSECQNGNLFNFCTVNATGETCSQYVGPCGGGGGGGGGGSCGGNGEACCAGGTCDAGSVCASGTCAQLPDCVRGANCDGAPLCCGTTGRGYCEVCDDGGRNPQTLICTKGVIQTGQCEGNYVCQFTGSRAECVPSTKPNGSSCTTGTECQSGRCGYQGAGTSGVCVSACGNSSQACCYTGGVSACNVGLECILNGSSFVCGQCGAMNQACCRDNNNQQYCDSGLACNSGICQTACNPNDATKCGGCTSAVACGGNSTNAACFWGGNSCLPRGNIGAPCTSAIQCKNGVACSTENRCVDPTQAGGLNQPCRINLDGSLLCTSPYTCNQSTKRCVAPNSPTPTRTPMTLNTTCTDSKLKVTWSAVTGAARYVVQVSTSSIRDPNGGLSNPNIASEEAPSGKLEVTSANAVPAGTYYVVVVAINSSNQILSAAPAIGQAAKSQSCAGATATPRPTVPNTATPRPTSANTLTPNPTGGGNTPIPNTPTPRPTNSNGTTPTNPAGVTNTVTPRPNTATPVPTTPSGNTVTPNATSTPTTPAGGEVCGNGQCRGNENINTCPADCSNSSCGDGFCSAGENINTCPQDCPMRCGDGICSAEESNFTCPADCPAGNTTPTPSPTNPNNTATATPNPSFSPTPTLGPTQLEVNVKLPGIGSGRGDNNSPKHTVRETIVSVYNSSNQKVAEKTGNLTYSGGIYKGIVDLGQLPTGAYSIYVKMNNTLIKRIPSTQLTAGTLNKLPQVELVTGDFDGTNKLDVLDYNSILGCFGKSQEGQKTAGTAGVTFSKPCELQDLNDDGQVEEKDVNIFLRGLAIRQGDSISN